MKCLLHIRITPYWLLGLIEGEGYFSVSTSNTLKTSFYLSLTSAQTPLVSAIKYYLIANLIKQDGIKLPLDYKDSDRNIIGVYNREIRGNSKPQLELIITHTNFLHDKFIPFLSGLTFVTKKSKDFLD